MKLLSLKLENFMGVKAFDFAPLGHSVTVLGANDSGKSTLETAYWWLLTGKNAEQSTDFDVYPTVLRRVWKRPLRANSKTITAIRSR